MNERKEIENEKRGIKAEREVSQRSRGEKEGGGGDMIFKLAHGKEKAFWYFSKGVFWGVGGVCMFGLFGAPVLLCLFAWSHYKLETAQGYRSQKITFQTEKKGTTKARHFPAL